MIDEVTRQRQRKCAKSLEGHLFNEKGECVKCGLVVKR